jgi:hypothetical protein
LFAEAEMGFERATAFVEVIGMNPASHSPSRRPGRGRGGLLSAVLEVCPR